MEDYFLCRHQCVNLRCVVIKSGIPMVLPRHSFPDPSLFFLSLFTSNLYAGTKCVSHTLICKQEPVICPYMSGYLNNKHWNTSLSRTCSLTCEDSLTWNELLVSEIEVSQRWALHHHSCKPPGSFRSWRWGRSCPREREVERV